MPFYVRFLWVFIYFSSFFEIHPKFISVKFVKGTRGQWLNTPQKGCILVWGLSVSSSSVKPCARKFGELEATRKVWVPAYWGGLWHRFLHPPRFQMIPADFSKTFFSSIGKKSRFRKCPATPTFWPVTKERKTPDDKREMSAAEHALRQQVELARLE